MFQPIKGGSTIKIQGLKINIPPLGYGTHSETGELNRVDVIKRSTDKKEQFWEVQKLPELLEEWREEELARQLTEPDYQHPELLKIKQKEWHRRLYGVWFYNNGKPVYLTGIHYFYLNYWYLDTGLPDYREIDLEYFYFWQYTVEDPKSVGIIEIRKRRDGKSYRSSCILYESISRSANSHGGIQSKNKDDAQDFFQIKLIPAFKELPFFFKPEYDTTSGDTPKESLRFFRTSKTGKDAKIAESKKIPELRSSITFKDRQAKAYDGRKLKLLVLDESGKVEVDVMSRHAVVKYCLMDNRRRIIGKMIVTSTVEEIGVKYKFKKLWESSNQYENDGVTSSGLYKFFIPASRSGNYDKYGVPDEEGTLKAIKEDRALVSEDSDQLNNIIRKEPLSEKEAFMVATNQCHFNSVAINDRIASLSIMNNVTTRGDLMWEEGVRDCGKVTFVKNPKGCFEICQLPESPNLIKKGYHGWQPLNGNNYIGGVDTIDIDLPKDEKRASKPAALFMKRFSFNQPSDPYGKAFILKYIPSYRPKAATEFYEELIKACVYLGAPILVENNKSRCRYYMIERGYEAFLITLPGEKESGVNANPTTKGLMLEQLQEHVKENLDKHYYIDVLEDYLEFDIKDSTTNDLSMAAGWCVVADKHKLIKQNIGELKEITDFFKLYKVG